MDRVIFVRIRRLAVALFLVFPVVLPMQAQRKTTVSGYIRQSDSGEGLPGVSVMLDGKVGCYSGNDGYFTLSVPQGRYRLRASCIGFSDDVRDLNLQRDTVLTLRLVEGVQMDAAVVSSASGSDLDKTTMGVLTLPKTVITTVPALMGEPDILKTAQLFPGIQQGMDGSSGIYVRGGGPDENLFLLDGVPVYNVSHLLGMFSSFTPEAVKNVEIYKEAFPARFGGRLSSVVDISTNDGAADRVRGSLSLGLLNTRGHLEGPMGHQGTTFSLSGRLMHTGILAPFRKAIDPKYWYFFYDLNGKVVQSFKNGDKLSLTLYSGMDDFNYAGDEEYVSGTFEVASNRVAMDWGNNVAALSWIHHYSGRMYSVLDFSFNSYRMNSESAKDHKDGNGDAWTNESLYKSGMRDYRTELRFVAEPSPVHKITFGVSGIFHQSFPQTGFSSWKNQHVVTEMGHGSGVLPGGELSAYAEDDMRFGAVSVHPGLRYVMMIVKGKTYHSLEPRLSAMARLGAGFSMKASYSRMSQYMHVLSTSTLALPTDLWVPVTKEHAPMSSNQYALGAYYNPGNGIEVSLEGYYKTLENILEYRDGVSFFGNPAGWEYLVEAGRGRSYGMELLLRKKNGRFTGWLGYTLSWAERKFESLTVNAGNWFPYKYDRRHNLVVSARYDLPKGWGVNAVWTFASGARLSLYERQIIVQNSNLNFRPVSMSTSYIPGRNNYELPPSHHLELSADWNHHLRHCSGTLSFGLNNAYNSMNPNIVFVQRKFESNDDATQIRVYYEGVKLTYLPIMPFVNYTWKF